MRHVGPVPRAGCASALVVVLLLTASCGGDGSGPAVSPTRTPSATLPSPDRPAATRSVSRSSDPSESPEDPSAAPTSEPAEQESSSPAPTTDETQEPAEEPVEEASEEPAGEDDVPTWLWWVLAALIVAIAAIIPPWASSRRRSSWRRELDTVEAELAWLARELLPGFRHVGSRDQVAGGWAVSRERVTAAEDRLTVLESTAPDDAARQRARSLRDGARQARAHMEQLIGPGPHDTWALDLDAIIADLEAVLRRPSGPSPR